MWISKAKLRNREETSNRKGFHNGFAHAMLALDDMLERHLSYSEVGLDHPYFSEGFITSAREAFLQIEGMQVRLSMIADVTTSPIMFRRTKGLLEVRTIHEEEEN